MIRAIASVWFSSEIVETPANREIAAAPLTSRVVVIVVDGLRYDTAFDSGLMPKLDQLARDGAAGVSLASQVTMTGLGVRTIGTGTSPGLADILLETQLPRFTYDNLFASLRERGGHVAWIGNSAWKELFGDDIDVDLHVAGYLNVMAEADNVWGADMLIAARGMKLMARTDWQLCVLHFGGLDNASHRFTPFGEPFRDKARSIDDDIARIVAAAGPQTTTIITSDHGTSDAGHHGSGEQITRRTPLVLTGAATAAHRRLDAQQTDIAPTIAALLGVPIPAPAEGRVLVEALAISPATADALVAANVHQQQRYADAVARARGTEAPKVESSEQGLRRLGQWIAHNSARSTWSPLLWAVALMLVTFGILATPALTIVNVAIATLGVVGSATTAACLPTAVFAVTIAGCHWVAFVMRGGLRGVDNWRNVTIAIVLIAAVEVLFAFYKLNHRFIEMKMNDVYALTSLSNQSFQLVVTVTMTAVVGLCAHRYWPRSQWAVIAAIFLASALADTWAIPAALVFGGSAALVVTERKQVPAIVAAGVVGLVAIWLPERADSQVVVDVIALLALGSIGAWMGPTRTHSRLLLVALAVAAAGVRLAGNPQGPYRATLVGIMVAAVIAALIARRGRRGASDRPLVLLGFAAALVVAMLSRSSQMLGLIAWTGFAGLLGRSTALKASDDRAVVAATFAIVAYRFACFAVFERVFEFSHLEVWVAYEGNPKVAVAFGAAALTLKFTLPLVAGVCLIAGHMTTHALRRVVTCVVAFFCLRIAHLAIGMTLASGTFYSPYMDSGQLVFTALMLTSAFLLVVGWVVWRGAARVVDHGSMFNRASVSRTRA